MVPLLSTSTPTWTEDQTLGSDAVLLYNVKPWSELGFGVPNFADRLVTQNKPWATIARAINLAQFAVMTHVDARREHAPSINTALRLAEMLNQAKKSLGQRAVAPNEVRLESGHVSPSATPWTISPVPYFNNIVVNAELGEINEYVMVALANIFQSSDNNLALEITQEVAQLVWQYLLRCSVLIGTKWLGLSKTDVSKEDFMFDLEKVRSSYNPPTKPGAEDTIVPLGSSGLFTETNLVPLRRGYAANLLLPNLSRFPVGKTDGNPAVARGVPVRDAVSPAVPSAVAPL